MSLSWMLKFIFDVSINLFWNKYVEDKLYVLNAAWTIFEFKFGRTLFKIYFGFVLKNISKRGNWLNIKATTSGEAYKIRLLKT